MTNKPRKYKFRCDKCCWGFYEPLVQIREDHNGEEVDCPSCPNCESLLYDKIENREFLYTLVKKKNGEYSIRVVSNKLDTLLAMKNFLGKPFTEKAIIFIFPINEYIERGITPDSPNVYEVCFWDSEKKEWNLFDDKDWIIYGHQIRSKDGMY